MLEWLNYISTELHKSCAIFFQPQIPKDLKSSLFTAILKKKLSFVEQRLTDTYLMGKDLSLPDFYLFVVLFWLPHIGLERNDWPRLAQYF